MNPRHLVTPSRLVAALVAVDIGGSVYWWLSPMTCGTSAPPICERDHGGWLEVALAVATAGFVGLLLLSVLERLERDD